jgi:glycosyltransferase involved in cell wall biosynthesis
MATFNGAAHLWGQLQSLARQKIHLQELVVVDDGSSDHTISMLRAFEKGAPFPVRLVINSCRLGYRASFLKAASLCQGDAIAFCDQDDLWDSAKVATLQGAFNENPEVLLVYHNSLIVTEDGKPLKTTFPKRIRDHLLNKLQLSPCAIVPGHALAFRRSLNFLSTCHRHSVDPYSPNELMPHDMWMPFWASTLGQIKYVSDTLVTYRLHGSNASGWPVTWWAFAWDHIHNAQLYVHANKTLARNRGDLLRHARTLTPEDQRPSLDVAANFYRGVELQAAQRAEIYDHISIFARACAFRNFVRGQNYKRGSQCYGFDALLLDLLVGVLCDRLGRLEKMRP